MKLIVLDRDGVINYDSKEYIKSPDEWLPIPGSLEAIAKLNSLGYTVTIVTNQSGIARGYYDVKTLNAIHDKMHTLLSKVNGKVDSIFYCPHHPDENCHCRKPQPGLLEQVAKHYDCELENIFMIGDKLTDIEVFQLAGGKAILLDSGLHIIEHEGVPRYKNLAEFVDGL